MTEPCYHMSPSETEPGRVRTVCFRCGHVGYEKGGEDIVVKMINIPDGEVMDVNMARRSHDAVFAAFSIPFDLLKRLNEEPPPLTRIERYRNIIAHRTRFLPAYSSLPVESIPRVELTPEEIEKMKKSERNFDKIIFDACMADVKTNE